VGSAFNRMRLGRGSTRFLFQRTRFHAETEVLHSEGGVARVIYHRVMKTELFLDDQFKAAVVAAGAQARIETLQAGIPVFYRDNTRNLEILEYPSGQKFEICFLQGAPGDKNYTVLRELKETAA